MTSDHANERLTRDTAFRPRWRVVLKKFFWNAYDHIGKLMIASAAASFLALSIVGLPAAISGLFGLATEIAFYREVSVGSFFRLGFRRYRRGLQLAAVASLGSLVIGSSLVFYSSDRLGLPLLSLVLLGLTIWFGVAFLVWLSVLVPLAHISGAPLRQLARDAVLVVLDNPLPNALHLVTQLVIWFAGAASVVGLILLSPGLSAVLAATFVREILGKYKPGLVSDDEEVRNFGDLFRPWQM